MIQTALFGWPCSNTGKLDISAFVLERSLFLLISMDAYTD